MLRFRDGITVGEAKTISKWRYAATIAAAAGGGVLLSTPARTDLELPEGVESLVPDDAPIITETLRRPGDSIPPKVVGLGNGVV